MWMILISKIFGAIGSTSTFISENPLLYNQSDFTNHLNKQNETLDLFVELLTESNKKYENLSDHQIDSGLLRKKPFNSNRKIRDVRNRSITPTISPNNTNRAPYVVSYEKPDKSKDEFCQDVDHLRRGVFLNDLTDTKPLFLYEVCNFLSVIKNSEDDKEKKKIIDKYQEFLDFYDEYNEKTCLFINPDAPKIHFLRSVISCDNIDNLVKNVVIKKKSGDVYANIYFDAFVFPIIPLDAEKQIVMNTTVLPCMSGRDIIRKTVDFGFKICEKYSDDFCSTYNITNTQNYKRKEKTLLNCNRGVNNKKVKSYDFLLRQYDIQLENEKNAKYKNSSYDQEKKNNSQDINTTLNDPVMLETTMVSTDQNIETTTKSIYSKIVNVESSTDYQIKHTTLNEDKEYSEGTEVSKGSRNTSIDLSIIIFCFILFSLLFSQF